MPLYGTLTSMPLPDLLQWLCNARVTGTLSVERDRVSKSIHLHKGMIVGCSSNDPAQRIGQYLLSRGQITEEQLREALQLQESSGQHLGLLCVRLGALSQEQLSANLEAQAECCLRLARRPDQGAALQRMGRRRDGHDRTGRQ